MSNSSATLAFFRGLATSFPPHPLLPKPPKLVTISELREIERRLGNRSGQCRDAAKPFGVHSRLVDCRISLRHQRAALGDAVRNRLVAEKCRVGDMYLSERIGQGKYVNPVRRLGNGGCCGTGGHNTNDKRQGTKTDGSDRHRPPLPSIVAAANASFTAPRVASVS